MQIEVYGYKNTGFNGVNIPYDESVITENFAATPYPSIDLLQYEGLTSIDISTTWDNIKNVDLIRLNSTTGYAWYTVTGAPTMTSEDVAHVEVVYQPIISSGGIGSLVILDGITERHTVGDDTMFKYTQSDEYLAPREALNVTSPVLMYPGSNNYYTLVESTIDLYVLGLEFNEKDGKLTFNGIGVTFTDESGETVTAPYVFGIGGSPVKEVGKTSFILMDKTVPSPNTALFVIDGENAGANARMNRAIGAVRALSMESAIISQTKYDKAYVNFNVDPSTGISTGWVSPITGKEESKDSGIRFKRYNARNNRLQYGEYNKYGLITAAGEKGEFLPEQIGDAGDTSPEVKMKADPRPDGKPYYRFAKYLSESTDKGFWVNALGGLQWTNVPLTYQGASGSYLNRLNFENDAKAAKSAYSYRQTMNGLNTAQNAVNGVFDFMSAFSDAGDNQTFGGWIAGMGKSISNTGFNLARNAADINQTRDQYKLARQKELQNYGYSQTVVAPEIAFPFNANVVRDFIGNGVYAYRYYYSDSDVARIDKLLTMYGYKDMVALTTSLFNQRQYFDYVRANGVSIGGSLPTWKKDLIADQLNAGVRVWHTAPDTQYYTNNPIK